MYNPAVITAGNFVEVLVNPSCGGLAFLMFLNFGRFLFRGSVCCVLGIVFLCWCHSIGCCNHYLEMLLLTLADKYHWIISLSCLFVGGRSRSCYSAEFSSITCPRLTLWNWVAVLCKSWGVILASCRSNSNTLSDVALTALVHGESCWLRAAPVPIRCWLCRHTCECRSLPLSWWEDFLTRPVPFGAAAYFHHFRRSNTDLGSQWQHIGGHTHKLVVERWKILIRLV